VATMPSLLSKSLQGVGVLTFFSVTSFTVWTKHAHISSPADFNPSTDPLFRSEWYQRLNPRGHEATYDECVRRIGLQKIRPELVEDARAGGSKLVEEFVRGVWGGPGYTIQRLYLQNKWRRPETEHQLWTTKQLRESDYSPSTQITDHFIVLSKTPTSVLIRCGDSPLNSPDKPRASDGLFEMCATADIEHGYAEFRMKSIFFVGEEGWAGAIDSKSLPVEVKGDAGKEDNTEVAKIAENWENRGPMQGGMWFAHKLYTKLWMESAVARVKA